MKYTVTVRERYNQDNYEFSEIAGGVEFTDEEASEARMTPGDFGRKQLDALLRPHRRRVLDTIPPDAESFIFDHPAMEN